MSYWRKKCVKDIAGGVPGRGSSMNQRNLFCLLLYPVLGHGGRGGGVGALAHSVSHTAGAV